LHGTHIRNPLDTVLRYEGAKAQALAIRTRASTPKTPMSLLSKSAKAAISTGTGGGYLNPSRIPTGTTIRFALTSDEPVEYYEVWGEDAQGKPKPFRFDHEPTPDEIAVEMGEYSRRINREGTGNEPAKFAIALPVFNYDAGEIQVMNITQKSIIFALDGISQMPDYEDMLVIDFQLEKKGSGLTTEYKLTPVPRKKGATPIIEAAWEEVTGAGFDLTRIIEGGNPYKK